ncbi:MAG: tRNA pseudouridine(55) synthase TruB [Clostridia bacterium]
MIGCINLLKPAGMTSSDMVVKARIILSKHYNQKIKVGHFGTLDPAGCGVLPIAVGNATRLFDYLMNKQKTYRATFVFGKTTDTLDSYGKIEQTCETEITAQQVQQIIPQFLGKINQIPPQYSSVSVDGKRCYAQARKGVEVQIEPRVVQIFEIKLLNSALNTFTFDITCSGGTYIRSIARDMAQALNTVGYMSWIIRLKSGDFSIENAITLDELESNIEGSLVPISEVLKSFKSYDAPKNLQSFIKNGVKILVDFTMDNQPFVVKFDGEIYGIAKVTQNKLIMEALLC